MHTSSTDVKECPALFTSIGCKLNALQKIKENKNPYEVIDTCSIMDVTSLLSQSTFKVQLTFWTTSFCSLRSWYGIFSNIFNNKENYTWRVSLANMILMSHFSTSSSSKFRSKFANNSASCTWVTTSGCSNGQKILPCYYNADISSEM